MNNRILLIVFVIGLLLFAVGKLVRGNRSSSFDPLIVALDTAKVDRLKFISGGPDAEGFELKRTASGWEVIQGSKKVSVSGTSVHSVLSPLTELNAKRIVTRETSKYNEFDIQDDQASVLEVWQSEKKVAHLILGGFRFDQAARTASSFIRKGDEPEVYLIDGFVSMGLKARFDQFRDKKLLKAAVSDLSSIEWMGHTGIKKTIQKQDGQWYYAGMEALDSTAFDSYLHGLVQGQGSTFSDITSTNGLNEMERVTISGNNMLQPTVITAFTQQDTLHPFLIHSTANPDAIFTSDSSGLYNRIFMDLRQFWPDGQ